MASRKLQVEIIGDASSLQRAFGQVGKSSSRLSSSFKTLGKVAAVGVGAAFAGLAATLKVGFDELSEGQKVAAQTGAVLKSTGGAANVTAKQVDKLAQSISQMSGIDDEAVAAGENLLLTFTNIRNEVGKGNDIFNQATLAIADMSTALGQDMQQSAIQLGKALNDPIRGVTALRRVGVSFTEEQTKMIKALVESGRSMDAQKLILRELTKEFGGSAKAAGETLPGQLSKLRNSFEEVAAGVAETLLPYLMKFLDWANRHMPEIRAVIQGSMDAIVAAIEFLAPHIARLIGWFQQLAAAAERHWPRVQRAAEQVINWYRANVAPAFENVRVAVVTAWDGMGKDLQESTTRRFTSIPPIVRAQLENMAGVVKIALALLRGDWSEAWEEVKAIPIRTLGALIQTIRRLADDFLDAAKAIGIAAMKGLLAGLTAGWNEVSSFVASIPGRIRSAIGDLSGLLRDAGLAVLQGFWDGLKAKWDAVAGWLGGLKDKITSLKGPERADAQLLVRSGQLIMEGLQRGMDSGWTPIARWLSGLGSEMEKRIGDVTVRANREIGETSLGSTGGRRAASNPELFVPSVSGRIVSNAALATGVSNSSLNVNFYGPVYGDKRQIALAVRDEIKRMGDWNSGGMFGGQA